MTDPSVIRDKELAKKTIAPLGSPFDTKVVGASFAPGYPANLYRLDDVWQESCNPPCIECGGSGSQVCGGSTDRTREGEPCPVCLCPVCNGSGHVEAERLPAILVRNPDNAYDPNAIEVHVPALGDKGMIGHLTRPIVARMAPEIDAGVEWSAEVVNVLINPSFLDRPGISVRCVRVGQP